MVKVYQVNNAYCQLSHLLRNGGRILVSTLKLYLGVLISFSCNNIEVIGYLDKLITFIVDLGLKFIQTKSMLLQPYIIGRLVFNDKEAAMSTSNLRMKFPLKNGKIANSFNCRVQCKIRFG
ncbi:hypothetical protein MTR_2g046690 [Medicago truncatula]|uniref:Uncharacterized protein n=1 Tax=Medicago truncatula TaxID=3880 RepID=A0A072V7E8_MEDTR|nr:hypothetical protein MTR_2g046690 [Medicago truncatula]